MIYAEELALKKERIARSQRLLTQVGLKDRMNHIPAELSSGEKQRVGIARALANTPRLILADQPTGNLDSRTSEEVLLMFQQLNQEDGITILLVTHDPGVAKHAQRFIHISDGIIVDGDST